MSFFLTASPSPVSLEFIELLPSEKSETKTQLNSSYQSSSSDPSGLWGGSDQNTGTSRIHDLRIQHKTEFFFDNLVSVLDWGLRERGWVQRKIIIPFVVTSSAWRVRTAILDLFISGLCCVNTTNLPHGIFWLVASTSEILFTKVSEKLINLETFKMNKFAKIYHQTCLLLVPAESNTILTLLNRYCRITFHCPPARPNNQLYSYPHAMACQVSTC